VARRDIDHIRENIRLGKYDMTVHAIEEMAEDGLDILDFEQSILYVEFRELKKMTQGEQNTSLRDLRLRKRRYQSAVSAVLLTTAI
jgi:hypothetical protein